MAIVEMVMGWLDWGPAVVGDDGVVRPARVMDPPVVMADNSTTAGTYAHCDNESCQHRWRLRRQFAPTSTAKEERHA
ncbi:hypothetical protein [Nonomuraea sp. NPDC023979]|uniref:hypothetical protein n=1 Tax=Nonomuraea sp. NPDC023979 TaxID=3154796 RepID=UPI0033E883A0